MERFSEAYQYWILFRKFREYNNINVNCLNIVNLFGPKVCYIFLVCFQNFTSNILCLILLSNSFNCQLRQIYGGLPALVSLPCIKYHWG